MNFMNKMERKFGKYAIHNLTLILIITYAAGYLIQIFAPEMIVYLILSPGLILRGQVWRLVSWILIPPGSFSMWTILTLFCYYSIGIVVERTLGDFRYNVYIFGGIILNIIGAFVLYFVAGGITGEILSLVSYYYFSTYYISMSMFAAFAALYPNMQVLFMMFIPLKAKWLGILYIGLALYDAVRGGWGVRTAVLCSLINFVLFFMTTRNMGQYRPKEIHRRQNFKRAVNAGRAADITKHKCAICGRTEKDGDHLEFRFCSKCNGNYEYCQDHLFTHTHVQ